MERSLEHEGPLNLASSTASVYYPNGSYVDIAKLPGGPSYRQAMRSTDNENYAARPQSMTTTQKYLKTLGFRDHLPPWLGGPTPFEKSLSPMLRALKEAASTYMESPPSIAQVSWPLRVSQPYLDATISALSSLSVEANCCDHPEEIYAARAYGTARECDFDPWDPDYGYPSDQLVLSVDYTGAALTVMLLDEYCGTFIEYRETQNTSLGADASDLDCQEVRAEVAAMFRESTELPLVLGDGQRLEYFDYVVFSGEFGNDSRLQQVLREVIREKYDKPVAVSTKAVDRSLQPLFASSRGTAKTCWHFLGPEESQGTHPEV